jgi:hypothetical protein
VRCKGEGRRRNFSSFRCAVAATPEPASTLYVTEEKGKPVVRWRRSHRGRSVRWRELSSLGSEFVFFTQHSTQCENKGCDVSHYDGVGVDVVVWTEGR